MTQHPTTPWRPGAAGGPDSPEEPNDQGPVVRDRRRIDPQTGAVREPPSAAPAASRQPPSPAGSAAQPGQPAQSGQPDQQDLATELAERTADLQRLQAEYVNYKRRVDRDRDANRQAALATVLGELLGVLDNIGRAREHGELEGAFKLVGESIENATAKLGLECFGEVGDEFDPRVHEALLHDYSAEVSGPTCTLIMQPGYRINDRVLRPARVGVSEPEPAAAAEAVTEPATAAAEPAGEPAAEQRGEPPPVAEDRPPYAPDEQPE